ncbi:hypothetical protein L861_13620 [Litchfieldella anticariensis FP35 = DSM 16096]|uniref:Uncharacterized protein n=1 Tax=Litchfieldella anticariensis (strain DSM 16096 / CECT 5854 / CIP 108499 / LMG 22089 / FP35) TaxID=1121939 RepID=S2KZI6_LITA3|nr:hypothetical protein [Halomonas anticariensis]EPC00824.1 hypothetical protein L861_13620 [Halomonas anticariensis FP35 = DSM 16096]
MKVTTDRANDDYRLRDSPEAVTRTDETGTSKPVDPDRQADFSRAVESSQARQGRSGSLLKHVERLGLPDASDPSLYSNERSIELLQHVVDNLLPRLDAASDVTDLASQLLTEEIDQRLAWEARYAEDAKESET